MTADEIIQMLALAPHPEGGHFRETFRDAETRNGRPCGTAIYFLLKAGEVSRWHRVDAAETWHWYAGAPLELKVAAEGAPAQQIVLGNGLSSGQRPQAVVPKDHWQSARSLGDWTLTGCTVAPGFEFSGFEMAAEGWQPREA